MYSDTQIPVLYLRYSSNLQRTDSCVDQERQIREHLTRKGINHANAMVLRDEAQSGTRENRIGYREIRKMVKCGKAILLAVDDQSRLGRNESVIGLIKAVVFMGGRVICVHGLDTLTRIGGFSRDSTV